MTNQIEWVIAICVHRHCIRLISIISIKDRIILYFRRVDKNAGPDEIHHNDKCDRGLADAADSRGERVDPYETRPGRPR